MVLTLICRQLYHLGLGFAKKPTFVKKKWIVSTFRALPLDLDMFMHINNTAYPRIAELASWELMAAIRFNRMYATHGFLGLVITQQQVTYKKPISPFQLYEVHTNIQYADNKWLDYTHHFVQHHKDVPPGNEPIHYATVTKRGVVKTLKGRTIKVDEFINYLKCFE